MSIKVLSIGTDRKIFEEGSPVEYRLKGYSTIVEEMHVIVFSKRSLGLKERQVAPNVWAYPTNSVSRWLYPIDAVRIAKRLVFEKKFTRGKSVITTQDPFECGWVGLQVKKKWRIPLEVELHTDPFSTYFTGFLNFIRKCLMRMVIPKADSVRVVTRPLGQKIAEVFRIPSDSVYTLPLYVDTKRIEAGRVTFDLHARYGWKFIMLSVSRLSPEKNLGVALKVLSKILKSFPDAGLVIVGDGVERAKLERSARELGVISNVAFAGWQEDLASYYHTANLYLQTSAFEGYGLSLVEAALSGLPVVTTPVGIALELENGKDAIVCPQGNIEYMSNAVYDLITNDEERELLRRNGKQTVESIIVDRDTYLKKASEAWMRAAEKVS